MSQKIVGSFEKVSLPELGVYDEIAKIDTGAYSGALHCTDIREQAVDGQKVLTYTVLGDTKMHETTTKFVRTFVRSSTGHRVRRYIIDTTIDIGGTEYPIRIGLSDRSDMKRPILIGRRFLREQNFIVDVARGIEYDSEGERSL